MIWQVSSSVESSHADRPPKRREVPDGWGRHDAAAGGDGTPFVPACRQLVRELEVGGGDSLEALMRKHPEEFTSSEDDFNKPKVVTSL